MLTPNLSIIIVGGKRKWKIIEKIRTLEIIRIVEILKVNLDLQEAKKAKEVQKLIEKLANEPKSHDLMVAFFMQ